MRGAGVTLAVHERGPRDGPTVVLVHGYPDTHAVWDPVARMLAEDGAAPCHVVTYDVRGAGASDAPARTADYALALLVDDLAAVIDATSPERAVHLVGHDWGSVQGWEATRSPRLRGRLSSFTSISGPSLDHVGLWLSRQARGGWRGWRTLAGQGARSSYIGAFHVPGAVRASARALGSPRLCALAARRLRRREGVTDRDWPAPTFGADVPAGMRLYRANVRPRLRRPDPRASDVPVQLVVPVRDRYVPPTLLTGLERFAPVVWRRPVDAGHWVVRSHPGLVAASVAEVVGHVEGTRPSEALEALRVGGTGPGSAELPPEPLQLRNDASV